MLEVRSLIGALFDEAPADKLPLRSLVAANVTQEVLDAIAAGSKKGHRLPIRRILVASATMPGELPPAMIAVGAGGQRCQGTPADGGTTQQVFLTPPELVFTDVARRQRTVYVIRDARLEVDAVQVQPDGAACRLAYIPDSFDRPIPGAVDRDCMNALCLVGYRMGRDGDLWATRPPSLDAD